MQALMTRIVLQNAFVFSGDDVKDIDINFGMHKNIIEGLEAAGCKLQHVYFNSGGKWYGESQLPFLHHHASISALTIVKDAQINALHVKPLSQACLRNTCCLPSI